MDDNRIFIGKIPQSVGDAEIKAHFAQFGEIEHVQCPFSNKPFKIAFVTYTEASGRDKAIAFTDHNLQNSPLNVVKASPKPEKSFDSGGFGQQGEARIFVGHIPEEVTEEMLRTHFSSFGTLLKCFKPNTGSRSVGQTSPPGYAFVTFSSHKEKHLCLAQEDHTVEGHTLRVMEAKPKPASAGGFGGGFGGSSSFGGAPRGYGAGAGAGGFGGAYGGSPYGGSASYGAGASGASRNFVAHGQDEVNPKRVFISHIAPAINDGNLRGHFSQFGVITDVFIPQPQPADSSAEDPKGFAYVSFEDSTSVYRTLAVKEHLIQGARVDVQEARPKSSRRQAPPQQRGGPRDARVFVGKIPKHVTDDIVGGHFSQFGEVKEFYRPRDQNARDGLAFGFLTYTSIHDLARCLAVPQHVLSDGTLLSVTRARPRPGPGGDTSDTSSYSGGSDTTGFGNGQQMQVQQMFGQPGFGSPQTYNPYGQQSFAQQQFGQGQQFTQAAAQQQFASAGQFAQQSQAYGAMNQGAYGGVAQLQQGAGLPQGMPQGMTQGYGATPHQRTNQRFNPY